MTVLAISTTIAEIDVLRVWEVVLVIRAGSVSKFSGFGFFKEVEYGFGFLRFFILQNFSVSVFNGFA